MNRKSIEDYVWKFFHRNTCYSPEFSPCSGNPNYGPPAESSYLYVDTKPITPDHIENTFFKTMSSFSQMNLHSFIFSKV